MSADAPWAAIALPQTTEGRSGPIARDVVAMARLAEEAGLHSVWTSELTTTRVLSPLLTLAHCAAVTDEVRLGVAVLLSALQSPLRVAQDAASLDQLSDGRLVLGVGLGGNPELYRKHGIDADGRGERFETGIRAMQALVSGDAVPETDLWSLDGTEPVPAPVQRPRPPLWFGARSEPGIRRAVRLGDGFVGSGSEPTAVFAEQGRLVRDLVSDVGDARPFRIAKRLYFVVDDDHRRAQETARSWFGKHYGKPALGEQVAALGAPERCAEEVADVVDAGADIVIFNPIVDELHQFDRLIEEVLPAVPVPLRPRVDPRSRAASLQS